MRSLTAALAVVLVVATAAAPAGAGTREDTLPAVVPAPAGWAGGEGSFRPGRDSRVLAGEGSREEAERLAADLREVTGLPVPVVVGGTPEPVAGDVVLTGRDGPGDRPGDQAAAGGRRNPEDPEAVEGPQVPDGRGNAEGPQNAEGQGSTEGRRNAGGAGGAEGLESAGVPEGYRMELGAHVEIAASTPAGLFYGGRTLLQLLRAGGEAPYGRLEDRPEAGSRMVVLDVQGGFWPVARIEDLVRRMSWLKLNTLYLRLSGDAALRLHDPAFAGAVPGLRYTRSDIEAVQATARRHHVTVVPEIDVLGDTAALTPSRRCAAELVPDLADPEVRRRLTAVLDAFTGWFDAPLVGLGRIDACDEPEWLEGAAELAGHVETPDRRPVLRVRDRLPALDGRPVILNEGSPETGAIVRNGRHDVIDAFPAAGSHAGDLLAWTPEAEGFGRALIADTAVFGDPGAAEAVLAGLRAEFAERAWNRLSPAEGFADRLHTVGDAPGLSPEEPAVRVEHRYTFDTLHVPEGDTHVPAAWRDGLLVTAADGTGGVHATAAADGAPRFPVPGRVGGAARFGEGRRFVLGAASKSPPWTVSMWVRSEDRARGVLLGRLDRAIVVDGGEVAVSGAREFSFGHRLPLNRWTHLVLVADPRGTTLYVNGRRTGRVPEVIDLPTGSMGPFGGALDEVVMSGRALTAAQVAAVYAAIPDPVPDRSAASDPEPDRPAAADLARGRPVTASGVEAAGLGPEKAVDGDPETRWASALKVDPQWIRVDLGAPRDIARVVLRWERAYGSRYRIEGSADGVSWTRIREVADGNGEVDDLRDLSATARYIRVYGMKRGTKWGYSLKDLAVYGG
ncbi:discoidin domain-containing protein [Planomonospora sp. ID91781]|uniref:discoidin domain-containing protein n=1 Tax=Planomonospora sp. ID91781 TaxID=2738135 RepID=UPI0018C3860D|nr:discoidin domain-containing protein [Planomonospora sp. ID91781]MBG0821529.1 discoidin domain-containing protein [Planomonospora sp. ID91781]